MSRQGRRDGLRWGACFVLVLGVHAAAAATLLARWQPADEPVAGGPPILIDLAAVAAAPDAPPSDAAPGPLEMQTASEPQPAPQAKSETQPKPEPHVAAVTPPQDEPAKAEPAPAETLPVPETPPTLAEVVLPPPRPPHKTAESKEQQQRHKLANLNSAPPRTEHTAARAVAPSPGAPTHDPSAVPNWKSELVARLQRYKRYPSEAQARGEEGVAQLAFSVDRSGGVHNARIVRSSGSSLLDRATLELVERAQPLPAPPPDVHGAQIAIVVPINYNLRGAR